MSFPVPVTGLVISPIQMHRKSCCTTLGIGICIGTMLKFFYVKIFYVVMGKVLSDELYCTRTGLLRLSSVLMSECCQVRQSILWLAVSPTISRNYPQVLLFGL